MGLSRRMADTLLVPLRDSSFGWRLPFGALPKFISHQRGLPQGMAMSVLLAECAIAPLVWKVHHATVREKHALAVAYVDDLNFMVGRGKDRLGGLLSSS